MYENWNPGTNQRQLDGIIRHKKELDIRIMIETAMEEPEKLPDLVDGFIEQMMAIFEWETELPRIGDTCVVVPNKDIQADFPDDGQWIGYLVDVVGFEDVDLIHDDPPFVKPLIHCKIYTIGFEIDWNFFHVMLKKVS